MSLASLKKPLTVVAVFVLVWLGIRYVLPVTLPFLLGAVLAVAAEPLVRPVAKRLPRGVAAGIGVTAAILGIGGIVFLLGAVAVREVGHLAGVVPQLSTAAQEGIGVMEDWLVTLSERAPEGVRTALLRTVTDLLDDGTVLMEQVTNRLPRAVGTAVGWVGDGVLGLFTGLVAAFLISARLPRLKAAARKRLPASWHEKYLPALRRVGTSLGGWLKAQLKLSAVTYGIVTVGFLVLRIPYAPVWAVLVALVDAMPILGTGTVLLPWALVCLLQRESLRAIGLLCIYAAAFMTRTVLEPKIMGRQLGIDPLITLLAVYVGYRLWGFPGMLLAPILVSATKSLSA